MSGGTATIAVANHVAFIESARRGDLPAVQRFFAQPEVLVNAALWEDHFRQRRLNNDATEEAHPNNSLPRSWFANFQGGWAQDVWSSLLRHNAILRWFFSNQGLALVGETLRASMPHFSILLGSLERLEIVFESRLFTQIMGDDERKVMLDYTIVTLAQYGSAPVVDALFAYGADPNAEYDGAMYTEVNINTPLAVATCSGKTMLMDKVLEHGAWVDDDRVLAGGWRARQPESIRLALQHGADANRFSSLLGSPLHHATIMRSISAMETLIRDSFADIEGRDRLGCTPLMAAVSVSDESWPYDDKMRVVEWLFDRGADLHAVDLWGRSVLHWAVRGKSIKLIKLCLSRGANPNCHDGLGRTPMAVLLIKARYRVTPKVKEVLELLLEAGGDPFVCDRSGKCAAEMLTREASSQQFLKDHGLESDGSLGISVVQ